VRLLSGLRKPLFAAAGISFLVGGGLIHAETQMDRFSAELVGLGIAALCFLLGFLAGRLADNLNTSEEDLPIRSSD
jgi:hypothetical protein